MKPGHCAICGSQTRDDRSVHCRKCFKIPRRLDPSSTTKCCTKCKSVKPIAAFNKRTAGYDPNIRLPESVCRICKKKSYSNRTYSTRKALKARLAAIEFYSQGKNFCACCGENRIEFLSLDHMRGDGAQQRRDNRKQRHSLPNWLRVNNYPPGFQVLCYNCNFAKRQKEKCPHHKWPGVMIRQFCDIHGTAEIGEGTEIWNYVSVCAGAKLGTSVVVGSSCWIGKGTVIGNNSRLQTGVFLPNNSILGENVFCGPHVIATDDKYPRVGNHDYNAQPPNLKSNCSLGASAVILPGITVGEFAVVGAGAVVTHDVEPHTIVVGSPAIPISAMQSPSDREMLKRWYQTIQESRI